jgi:hypothetical protein
MIQAANALIPLYTKIKIVPYLFRKLQFTNVSGYLAICIVFTGTVCSTYPDFVR